jgi:hypothetical protein
LNSTLDEQKNELVYKRYYHVGIATATDQGLIVPVLRDADKLSPLEAAREIQRLADGARAGKLAANELTGSTFTITSLGKQGGLLATPILNHPEVGILGVHRIKEKPVVKNGQIVVGNVMTLSLSFDHRIIDGHVGAAFAYDVISYLENPQLLLIEVRGVGARAGSTPGVRAAVARGPGPAYHHAVHPRQLSVRPRFRLPLAASLALAALLVGACDKGVHPPDASKKPAPRVVDVEPASPPFKVTVESFADVRILRYQVPGFAELSKNQKLLINYLQESALSWRDITYYQHNEHNQAIKRTLEAILTSYQGEHSGQAWDALSTYAKRVWFSNGIHHHYSSKKFLPDGLTRDEFAAFVRGSDPKKLPLGEK